MKGNVGVRADLKKMGYSDELIPDWVAAGVDLPTEGAGGSSLQKPKPAGAPVRVGRTRKKTSTELSQLNSTSSTRSTQLPSSPRKIYARAGR